MEDTGLLQETLEKLRKQEITTDEATYTILLLFGVSRRFLIRVKPYTEIKSRNAWYYHGRGTYWATGIQYYNTGGKGNYILESGHYVGVEDAEVLKTFG